MEKTTHDIGIDVVVAFFDHTGDEAEEDGGLLRGGVVAEDGDDGLEDVLGVLVNPNSSASSAEQHMIELRSHCPTTAYSTARQSLPSSSPQS